MLLAMTLALEFFVKGPPVPKKRARMSAQLVKGELKRRWHTPQETIDYEHLVFAYALAAKLKWQGEHGPWPLDRRYIMYYEVHTDRPQNFDMDNVGKSLLDGCNPRALVRPVWNDDRQAICVPMGFPIVSDAPPGVFVRIEVTDDGRVPLHEAVRQAVAR